MGAQTEQSAERRARAVELRAEGLTHRQIGERLGVSRGTVGSWLSRGEKRMKRGAPKPGPAPAGGVTITLPDGTRLEGVASEHVADVVAALTVA